MKEYVVFEWEEVADSVNNLYNLFYPNNTYKYVQEISQNALPHCMTQIMAMCCSWDMSYKSDNDDLFKVVNAYFQLQDVAYIGTKEGE